MRNIFLSLYLILQVCFPVHAVDRVTNSDVVNGQISVKNLLGDKGSFEKNALGWSGYDDAAAVPVDGTGGTVTTTCTRTTSTPLSGSGSFLYTPAALGEGCSVPFTVETKDTAGTVLQVSFDYAVVSGTYTDDDTQIWIYDVTSGALIQPAPYKLKKHTLTSQPFAVEFQTTSASTSYRLLIHQATSGTAILKIDNITIGKQAKFYGSGNTDWQSFTPTGSWTTNTTYTGKWSKSGDSAEIDVLVSTAGVPTTAALTINLPAGMSIDTAKINSTNFQQILGEGKVNDSSTSVYAISVRYNNTTSVSVVNLGAAGTYVNEPSLVSESAPIVFGASDFVSVHFKVPILGWSSSQIMNSDAATRRVSFHAYMTNSVSAPSGTYTKLDLSTVTEDSHGAYDSANDQYIIPVSGSYRFAYRAEAQAYGGASDVQQVIYKNGAIAHVIYRAASSQMATIELPMSFRIDNLKAGDLIDVRVVQNSGGSVTVGAASRTSWYIQGELISGPSQIMASESVSARYTTAAGQSLTSSGEVVDFGTKDYDSMGAVTTGAAWKFTAPISGEYSVSTNVYFNELAWTEGTANAKSIAIRKNGTIHQYVSVVNASANHTGELGLSGTGKIKLLAGDYIDIFVATNEGADRALYTNATLNWVAIDRVGNY